MPEEKRIFLVDRESIFLGAATLFLESCLKTENEIFSFSNPYQALMKIKSMSRPPDLTVTDLKMPGMSGVQLAREIKSIFSDARVIIMTRNASSKLLTGIGDLVYKVISKNMSSDDLLGEIEKALN